jgi:retinol dehydrogenase 14
VDPLGLREAMASAETGPMSGRTVLVTGATGGVGKATAAGLAALGAHVAIIGRHAGRTEVAARQISGTGMRVDFFVGDLSAQSEVRRLADEVLQHLPRVDVLVNNVGGYWNTRRTTADGLERTFAVNHLAPFLLTNLLLERLHHSAPARVVTVASNAQRQGRIDFDDLQGRRAYSGARAYSQSKLANVLFTYELARRLSAGQVTANALHPGLVSTSFGAEDPGLSQRFLVPFLRPFMASPDRGAETSIRLASASNFQGRTGLYLTKRGPTRSSRHSYDTGTARRLWEVSADLVGLSGVSPGRTRSPRDRPSR